MKNLFVLLLSISVLVGCTDGVPINGARIISGKGSIDTIELPLPPKGYELQNIKVGESYLTATYRKTNSSTFFTKEYFKTRFMCTPAYFYAIKTAK